MAHERSGGCQTAGCDCERCFERPDRFVWNRQGWLRCAGAGVLGVRGHSVGLGCLDHAAKRREDLLISDSRAIYRSRGFTPVVHTFKIKGNPMSRINSCLVAAFLVVGTLSAASAQTAAPAPAAAAKPSKMK